MNEILFLERAPRDCGGNADVVVATLVREGVELGEVAVKKFRTITNDEMTEEKFLRVSRCRVYPSKYSYKPPALQIFANELRFVAKLSHPNLAKIIGFVEDIGNAIAWLVSPWEANGNLREFLRSGVRDIAERISLVRPIPKLL